MYLGDVSWHLVPVQTLAFHHPSLAWRGLRVASYCHHLDGRTVWFWLCVWPAGSLALENPLLKIRTYLLFLRKQRVSGPQCYIILPTAPAGFVENMGSESVRPRPKARHSWDVILPRDCLAPALFPLKHSALPLAPGLHLCPMKQPASCTGCGPSSAFMAPRVPSCHL